MAESLLTPIHEQINNQTLAHQPGIKVFKFQDTTATRKIFELRKRIRAVAGGTSASKTISILVWIIDYCQSCKTKDLVSIVSESYPHLEDGAMRDFMAIMQDRGYWNENQWHSTKHEYTFETGCVVEFLSVDTYGRAHGGRRDILFLNECNYIEYKIADQLITRTRKIVFMDWNPSEEFWFYTEMLGIRDDIDFITLTYLDNEALDEISRKEIESHKHNKEWWTVYGMGQLGQKEENIYHNWQFLDSVPHEATLVRRGLDFGFTNDPAALTDIYKWNGALIFDEQLYQKGMLNKQIADVILNLPEKQTLVIGDSAEPKSIEELRQYGVNILPSLKGRDSVNAGIQKVQGYKIFVTKRSINLIKEYRNYRWEKDKDGRVMNVPRDIFNHCMDGIRYGVESLDTSEPPKVYKQPEYEPMTPYEG